MPWKQRSHRVAFEPGLSARIQSIDGTQIGTCILKDISTTGAKLAIGDNVRVTELKEFILILSADGEVQRRCEFVRLDDAGIGVRFLKSIRRK